ncbi:hypothetical protein [Chitinimonas sp.]|uniref:hypothetical protein n=1 Tax=Chitinimonas sp. TaxID=1934313 RepID=UPI0035B1DCFD
MMPALYPRTVAGRMAAPLADVADAQPRVLHSLAVSRLSELNQAERVLRQLGCRIVDRQLHDRLDGGRSSITVDRLSSTLLDLLANSGKQLAHCMVDGQRCLRMTAFRVDVLWRMP